MYADLLTVALDDIIIDELVKVDILDLVAVFVLSIRNDIRFINDHGRDSREIAVIVMISTDTLLFFLLQNSVFLFAIIDL